MTRSRQGKFTGGQPPFGLKRDPDDKGHLIIDPETAPIIRHIYDLALDGMGCMRISKQLMEEKVPITHVKKNTEFDANYYFWSSSRISNILRNPFTRVRIWSAGHIRREFVPVLWISFPGRTGRSLKTAMKPLYRQTNGKRFRS